MTEQEWLTFIDPTRMLAFLSGKASDRKLRLFACACCRKIWHLITDQRSRIAVEVAERFADGLANRTERKAAQVAVRAAQDAVTPGDIVALNSAFASFCAVQKTLGHYEASDAANAVCYALGTALDTSQLSEQPIHANFVRDLFGNPFRPVPINPAWQTRTVVALAQAAYENRILPAGTLDNARLAILADALEEAGCTNADILNHLRQRGEHVRGCWVVDLLLGKE